MNKKGINIIRKFDNGGNVQAEGTGYFNMLGSPVTLKHLKENPGTYFKRYRDKNGQMITKNISSTQDGNVFVHGSKEHKEYLNDKESAEVELHTDGLGYNYNTGEPTDALPSGPNKRGNEKEENTESSDPIKGTLESEGNIYNSEGDPMDLTQEIEVKNYQKDIVIITTVRHIADDNTYVSKLPIILTQANMENPQKIGSAITYAKRYTLQSVYGLPSEDDDGNKAAEPTIKVSNSKKSEGVEDDGL